MHFYFNTLGCFGKGFGDYKLSWPVFSSLNAGPPQGFNLRTFWVPAVQVFAPFPTAAPSRLAQLQNRWVGIAETFQTNSPLCWGNYGNFHPKRVLWKRRPTPRRWAMPPGHVAPRPSIPWAACQRVGVQVNFTAGVFCCSETKVEGKTNHGQSKELQKDFDKTMWMSL